MRILLCTLLACGQLAWSQLAAASVDIDIHEIETNRAADGALRQTEVMATAISFAFDYLATFMGEAGPPPLVIQAELQATTERLDGVRSILVVERDGGLLHDAFSYPAPTVNLANRHYIRIALERPGLQFDEAIIGRTSGIPFAPLSAFKPSLNAVFVAIMDLRKIREPLDWCMTICGGAVFTSEGTLVAASPPETVLPEDIIAKILTDTNQNGFFIHQFEHTHLDWLIAFRKSKRFPIVIVTYKVVANTISPVTE